MEQRRLPLVCALVFLTLTAVLVASNWEVLRQPFFEEGDTALNAIQISRAKSFQEIHGNYSRFRFNHPGPAFFYVEALGEAVLSDGLGLLAPHHAHTVANTVLQAALFSLALYLLAGLFQKPFFLPLALLAGALHFSQAGEAFISIWPPHVLAMPFLAFWAACISVAAGRGQHLPWVALCGSFLVHGHVAQPLFVVSLALASYGVFWWTCRSRGPGGSPASPWRSHGWAHAIAAGLILVFLLPIALDLARGKDSNVQSILSHLRNTQDHKSWEMAGTYFLSFFGYARDQHELVRLAPASAWTFVRQHPVLFVSWGAVALLVVLALWGGFKAAGDRLRLLRCAGAFWVMAAALCLVWGVMQADEMYQFNGFFFHAVNYGLLLIACGVVAQWMPDGVGRWLGVPLAVVALVLAWQRFRKPVETSGLLVQKNVHRVLEADQPATGKLLLFDHDDWPTAASVALALFRAGADFRVDPNWGFMFGRSHEAAPAPTAEKRGNLSPWRIVRGEAANAYPLRADLKVVLGLAPLSPVDGTIDFSSQGNFRQYALLGFTTPAPGEYAYTALNHALIEFTPLPSETDVEIEIVAIPFFAPKQPRLQHCEFRFNNILLFASPFTEPGVLRARIPKALWNQSPTATIQLELPSARSFAELGFSNDKRRLGLMVKTLTARPPAR